MDRDLMRTLLPIIMIVSWGTPIIAVIAGFIYLKKRKPKATDTKSFKGDKITYDLTDGMTEEEGDFVAVGHRIGFSQNITIRAVGIDPEKLHDKLTDGEVDTELRISGDQVILTEKGTEKSFPRSSLKHVMCCSSRGSAQGKYYAIHRILVCLSFDNELGNATVAAYQFVTGAQSIAGTQTEHKYSDAFTTAEDGAKQIAEYLGVPYYENYYTGIFAPLANIGTN